MLALLCVLAPLTAKPMFCVPQTDRILYVLSTFFINLNTVVFSVVVGLKLTLVPFPGVLEATFMLLVLYCFDCNL